MRRPRGCRRRAAQAADTGPVFHGLFRTGARREAVAPVVSALWAVADAGCSAEPRRLRPQPAAAPRRAAGGALDLFQDQAPDARALFRGRV